MELVYDVEGKKVPIDLEEIAIGPKKACARVLINDRECIEVSRPYEIEIPKCKHVPILKKAYYVDVKRNAMVGDLHVCYEGIYDENDKPTLLCDDGFCMEGDKMEFGHFILWNEQTGELTISEELDWRDVCLPIPEEWMAEINGK